MSTEIQTDTAETLAKFQLDPSLAEASTVSSKAQEYVDAVGKGEEADPLSEKELEVLYVEAVQVDAALKRLTERKAEIVAQVKAQKDHLGYGTTIAHKDSGGGFQLGRNPIFNEARFLVKYPYDYAVVEDQVVEVRGKKRIEQVTVYPNRVLYKTAVDRTEAKRILSKEDYDAMFDEGLAKVTIK